MAAPVHIDGVSRSFGGVRAVNEVTLSVAAGELFFLLGPSGCGKTTLLRCVAGFYEPEAGRIRIGDRDVTALPPHLRDTGMVFQNYALWPHMTVRENVAFGLEMRRVPRQEIARRAGEALEMVRLADMAERKPNQLSGGQQQRVALARALVIRPQCLLLDEPLSNLDAKLRLEMRVEIRRICKAAGLTAIYVTHDQKEALSIADRLAVMNAGRIEQVGGPLEVYQRPANVFVAGFVGETNLLPATVLADAGPHGRVRTAIGDLDSSAMGREAWTPGERVTVSLRPEAVRLHDLPRSASNSMKGRLHHTVYLGEVAQHQVDIAAPGEGLVTLKVVEMRPRVVARDGEAPAEVWVDPEDVVVLRH